MPELFLRDDLAHAGGDAAQVLAWAQEIAASADPADVYRSKEGRQTLRFRHGDRSYFLKLHGGVGWKEVFKNLLQLRLPVLGAVNEYRAVAALHAATMARIGATPKSDAFFAAVETQFGAAHAPILLAEHEGAVIGALLLLRGGGWVEYFVPASDPELRQLQPMSLLVHHAMRDAVERGERYFNFGGTWESQTEVYRFKARFGAKDHPYRYWTRLYRPVDGYRALGKEGLLDAFPGFYVLPFDAL